MSKFKTIIPVDVQGVIAKLPTKSYVHSVTLLPDNSGVEVLWDNDALKTAYTFPLDFPLEKLGVSDNVTAKVNVDTPQKRGRKPSSDA